MSNTKTAEEPATRPIPWGRDAGVDAARTRGIGEEFRKGLMYGGLGGLGIGGLYYLSQYLGDKYNKATKLPDPVELAAAPISTVTAPNEEDESFLPEMPSVELPAMSLPFMGQKAAPPKKQKQQKAANFDPMFVAAPALGAGAGALIGAARASKGRRRQNAILGATLGGLGGLGTAAATSKPLWEYAANNMPKTMFPKWMTGGGSDIESETSGQQAWRNVINATLPAAGAAGGLALIDSTARQNENEQNLQKVEQARREYFEALTGKEPPKAKKEDDDKAEKKSNLDAALDKLYGVYVEKKSSFNKAAKDEPTFSNYFENILSSKPGRTWPQWLYDATWEPSDRAIKDTNSLMKTLMLTGGLGAGAIGAKYMYDQTRARSNARNLQLAQAARKRMQGLDTPWVDPQELADVKNIAANGAAPERGV